MEFEPSHAKVPKALFLLHPVFSCKGPRAWPADLHYLHMATPTRRLLPVLLMPYDSRTSHCPETAWPQNLECVLSGPLQVKFADPCSGL